MLFTPEALHIVTGSKKGRRLLDNIESNDVVDSLMDICAVVTNVFENCISCLHVYVAKILESLKQWEGQQFPVEIHARTKDEAHNEELFQKMTDIMAKHGVCFYRCYCFSRMRSGYALSPWFMLAQYD